MATAWSADAPGNMLQEIDVQTLPGQQLQLQLRLSGPAPEPLSFTIDRPARISLDLPDTGLALPSRRKDVDIGSLRTILAAEASGRTRIVLNLDSLVPYETRVEGNSIFVTLATAPQYAEAAPAFGPGTSTTTSMASTPTLPGERSIQAVDFRRGNDGSGRVIVTLSDPRTVVDLREQGNTVIVDFKNTRLPAEFRRRMDVLDFATPVSTVDARQADSNARLVVAASGAYEQVAYQSDNLFTVELKPYIPTAADLFEEQQNKDYEGERLTLNFQDIDTRAVLQLLADVSGMNVVVSDTVTGNVTLRLQNVPWDQALDIILETKGLDMRQRDNVVIIAPAAELANRERAELEKLKQFEELAPLRSEFIQVNYAKASELATLIQSTADTQSLLSERGSVAIDERTNTLLVQDTADKLAEIRRLVQTLDVPVRQVLIESRIVVVNDDFSRELGVRMGYTGISDNSSDGLISVTGSSAGSDVIVSSAVDNLTTTGSPFPVTLPNIDDRFNINAPSGSPVGSVALAILDSDYLLDLELSALQSEGRGEIVSTPRVITANQQEARIKQGVEIPFQEASASGATATQFKEAVLQLVVTPLITPDDRIIMDLQVSKDNVGEVVPSANGGLVPSIDTREVVTQVLVDDGETVVLGGIYETEIRETNTKVPVLGDIPVVGNLFRQTQRINNKAELLIFVTPRILKDGANLN
ncbi:MAG: type IV pilus secretin PilQ [Gammaproteobacteria bacterium]|nr:type IV pilus secretin PilQ [Gammaproteobacteria bacterium]NNF62219.1 type IV pilus secretin PilQ [Gammaproteobacteria bacterium]NNM21016.1 type IV pilus secretin PilQ [Gammaproteobacteria bacterium]